MQINSASLDDVNALFALENESFEYDRLSKRRIKHWIQASNAIFLTAKNDTVFLGYALVIMRKGSRSARLYSIAISKEARGQGIGQALLLKSEALSLEKGALFMRLEVAVDNKPAIGLYEGLGYRVFGTYKAYYENKADALRFQKAIKQIQSKASLPSYPWYQQTTPFTCGCASLMMAASSLNTTVEAKQSLELDIWRQATSIYMTSGHGGTHPIGLALAAVNMGFRASVFINIKQTPFIDGVRSAHKKNLLEVVHKQFCQKAKQQNVSLNFKEFDIELFRKALEQGKAIICLISTYHFDDKKIPHWVAITHIDDTCLYIHDPDIEEQDNPMDYQHIPIAIDDFAAMSTYGKQKLRTCVIIE